MLNLRGPTDIGNPKMPGAPLVRLRRRFYGVDVSTPPPPPALRIVPANEGTWDDLQAVLTGSAHRCQCTRQLLGDRAWWRMDVAERSEVLRAATACGEPDAPHTSGLLAYIDGVPGAWCAVDRRREFQRLRGSPVPWAGRAEDRDDPRVWAIACFVVRPGYRRQGLMRELVSAAARHAFENGACAVEGYPMVTAGKQITWDELSVGALGPFLAEGFREVTRPTVRRVVVRLEHPRSLGGDARSGGAR